MTDAVTQQQKIVGNQNTTTSIDGDRNTVDARTYHNHFHDAPQAAVPAETLNDAEARFAGLPVDEVPAPAGLPPGSRMPFRRNAQFVGREADLVAIARALKDGRRAAVGEAAVLSGMGGIGKTQLAAEFAYRYGRYFAGGVFWLTFADPAAIPAEIATCGGPRHLNLHRGYDGLALGDQIGLVAATWHGELPRLLVFDNCEEEELLDAWLPRSGGCRALVTSRKGAWSPHLGVGAVPLGVLARDESVALLRTFRPDLGADDPDLDAIADALGDLPLALHMAGSFLERYQHASFGTPARYLERINRPDLLEDRSLTDGGDTRSPTGHELHVARTFGASLERLDQDDPCDALALAVLARAAWFAPGEPIPRDLLALSADVTTDDEDAALRFEDAVRRLVDLGLIEQDVDGALTLHRLIAAFVRAEAGEVRQVVSAVIMN